MSDKTNRELSRQAKTSNDLNFINYTVCQENFQGRSCIIAKLTSNSNLIRNFQNKSKAPCPIVKSELGCKRPKNSFLDINFYGKVLDR